jgi:benzoylformate decarboxylase
VNAAEAIAQRLAERGVEEIFGNPGTTELPFLESVRQRYLLTLHDALAVGAADGAAQAGRRVAVANLHAAPGLGNAVGFIDTARRNRSPVVLTVGQQDLRHLDREPLLAGDFGSMVGRLVKFHLEVTDPNEAAAAADRALSAAMRPPMGPVLLSLPMNVMEAPARSSSPVAEPAPVEPEPVAPVADRLRSARRPALVVGYEVDVADGFAEVEALATRLGAPVFAEPVCSRSPIPSGLASFAGDLLPQSAAIASALGDFDTVALVGADLTLYPYSASPGVPAERLVYLGTDPTVPKKLGCAHAIGPLRPALHALIDQLPRSDRVYRRPADFGRANRVARAADRMGAEFVTDAIRRVFADHAVVDESVSWIPTMKATGFYRGRSSYFSSRSQQLGWGLAAAIGITLRRPRTVVVLGDGALQYSIQALWTLARYRLPTKIVVVNNGGYSILKSYAKANHPGLVGADYLEVPGVDVPRLAGAYGVWSTAVDRPQELEAALIELRERDGPALLDVRTDRTVPDLFS